MRARLRGAASAVVLDLSSSSSLQRPRAGLKRCFSSSFVCRSDPFPETPSWSVQKFFEGESTQKVDRDTLHKIAKRAHLKIPEEKEAQMCKEMEQILRCVELIQEVDTQGVEPMISPLQARNVSLRLREDTLPEGEGSVETGGIAEELLSRAPKREGSFYAVPKVKDQQLN